MPRGQCLSFVPLNERRHVELELVIGLRDSKGAINTRVTRLWLDELGPKAALGWCASSAEEKGVAAVVPAPFGLLLPSVSRNDRSPGCLRG